MTFGPCQETSQTAITLNQESNFTRREKNHSLFHWNTLTSPEVLIRFWLLSKSVASMIIGISMGQEICLILGQVSLSSLYWKKNLKRICVVRGETDKTANDIQARSSMARTMGENGKECQVEGEAKVVTWKTLTRQCKNFTRNLFHWPEEKEFKETIKNARKKLETPVAPAMPCKTSKKSRHGENRGKTNEFISKLACVLEADESTRLRMGEWLPNHHEDHLAGKVDNSPQHYKLVHQFLPMPQAMKIPAAKAAVDQEWETWKYSGVEPDESQK